MSTAPTDHPGPTFTQAEQDHYAYLIECNRAEREGRPQPAPRYTNRREETTR